MNTNQIAALLRPFIVLDETQLAQTLMYINIMLKWNARMSLTSVRRAEDIVTRHFGESFFAAACLLGPRQTTSVIDLGSGAGFPGLPLAMFASRTHVTLIEANSKKAAFLNDVIRALHLGNATVFNGRGEDYRSQSNLVTLRAVEKFGRSMPLAFGLVESPGRLALMIGKDQVAKARELTPQLAWENPVPIPGGHSRVLFIGSNPKLTGEKG